MSWKMASEEGLKTAHFDKILLQPFSYLEQVPGKQIRPRFITAFNFWLNIPLQKCDEIGKIVQTLQTVVLLLDDIQDSSELRRGIPAAYHIFGVPTVVNSANYAYYCVLEKVLNLGHPEATRVFADHALESLRGQGMEIYWRDNFVCPTLEEWKEMAKRKTGTFFAFILKLMQLFSDNKSDFTEIVDHFGLYFQIRDDYANLKSKKYSEGKGFCEDLSEGKFSFPIIHCIRNNLDDPRLMNIVRQRTTDVEVKKHALTIMKEMGSLKYCRKVITDLHAQIREDIERLGHNPFLLAMLDELKLV